MIIPMRKFWVLLLVLVGFLTAGFLIESRMRNAISTAAQPKLVEVKHTLEVEVVSNADNISSTKPTDPGTLPVPIAEPASEKLVQLSNPTSDAPDLKFPAALGPGARLWVAWRILDCVAAVNSPPCSVRLGGEAMPIRFRALWNSPTGVPTDPDFLIEIQSQWRKRALRIVATRADQICRELSALRLKMIDGENEQRTREDMARFTNAERVLHESWDSHLQVLQPNAKKAQPETIDDTVADTPWIACATLRVGKRDVEFLPGDQGKAREFDDAALAVWTRSLNEAADDMAALSKSTEQMTLSQLGEKLKGPLADAFQCRRTIDRQIATIRIKNIPHIFVAGAAADTLRIEQARLEAEIVGSPSVAAAERKMYDLGILRIPRAKAQLPVRTPAPANSAILTELESLIVPSLEVEKKF